MNSAGTGNWRTLIEGIAAGALVLSVSCGGDDPSQQNAVTPTTPTAGRSSPPTAGASYTGAAGGGGRSAPPTSTVAGSSAPVAGRSEPPPSATAGTTAPPAGGAGTTSSVAGTSGDEAGSAAGGAGVGGDTAVAGQGGDAGSGPAPSGDAFAIRGADPTEQSANGRTKGPYQVESYTSGYMRGDFSDATVWYPTSEDAKPPFGCVAVVPGFVSPQASIRNWGPFLASNGIVTITIGVPGSDVPQQRAMSLLSALETCMGENTREGSPVKGKLSMDHLGVSGWSMGGGGTLIAAAGNPQLKAAVSFAAWGPSGGAMNKVPVLMFEATADPLAASMSDGYYRAVPETTPKMLFEVQGSSHNVANDPANHDGIIGLYGLSWWKVYLEGDQRYKKFLLAPKPSIATSKFDHNLE